MKSLYGVLLRKFFILYFCVMVLGVSMLTLSNLYVLGLPFRNLLRYNIGAVLFEGIAGTLLLELITISGLGNARKALRSQSSSDSDYFSAWSAMVSFPSRIFWGMAVFGIEASVFYHAGEVLISGERLDSDGYAMLISTLLFEQTLSLILAVLFYTGARCILRPYILKIPAPRVNEFPRATFVNSLFVVFCCLLLIIVLSLFSYILTCTVHSKPFSLASFSYIALLGLCFAAAIYSLSIKELKSDFRVLIEAMTTLHKGSRARLKDNIPIVSNDEAGNLAFVFNRLQEKISREYDEIEVDLQLAGSVQKKLLPDGEKVYGACKIAGTCKPCRDLGGDFYDIIPLGSNKFSLIIGDVTGKGMPAALIMSAALLLFRNEIRHGGTAQEVLSRLNRIVVGLGVSDICLTTGISIFDMDRKVMQYASAGHVAPYVLSGSGARQLLCSSLPLGINLEEEYEQIEIHMKDNDRFVFYTDGIIDGIVDGITDGIADRIAGGIADIIVDRITDGTSGRNAGAFDHTRVSCGTQVSGFDVFERVLASTDNFASLSSQIDAIVASTGYDGSSRYEDDRTLVIVQYGGV